MLLVKTKLAVSNIDGIGLFADENISNGAIVIEGNDKFGIAKYSEQQWHQMKESLSKESFRQIEKYSYKDKDDSFYYLHLDDARFINHSTNPNIKTIGNQEIATRDIKKGEEILIDYKDFCEGL